MEVGFVPNPCEWDRWPEAEAMLELARNYNPSRDEILAEHYILWAVVDGDELLAAATARLTVEKDCEVVLVAGKDRHKWLGALDRKIGAAAAEAGATRMVAYGRAGWARSLKALGWASEGDGRMRAYSRALEA